MDIDLGSEVIFNIKLGDKVYPLTEPTVNHVKQFQVMLEKSDEVDAFMYLIQELGMPADVCEKLSVSQMKKLSEGLLGGMSEKK